MTALQVLQVRRRAKPRPEALIPLTRGGEPFPPVVAPSSGGMFPPPSFMQGPGMTSSPWLAAAPGPRECAEQLAVLRAQDRASKEQEQMRRTEEIARMQARIDYEARLALGAATQHWHGPPGNM